MWHDALRVIIYLLFTCHCAPRTFGIKRPKVSICYSRNYVKLRRAVAALDALPPLPHDGAVFDAMNAKFPADVNEPDLHALLEDLPESRVFTDDQWVDLLGTLDPNNDGNHLRALQHHIISKLPRESGVGPSDFYSK